MTNTAVNNKKYGFNAEAELLQHFRDRGAKIERLYLAGKEDEGDFISYFPGLYGNEWADWPTIIQLKTYAARTAKGAERPLTPGKLKGWLRDLDDQREAYRAHRGLSAAPGGMLVVKFKNTSWEDALVINSLGRWLG